MFSLAAWFSLPWPMNDSDLTPALAWTHLPKLEHLHVMGTCLQLLDLGLLGSLVLWVEERDQWRGEIR
jgi:hypothetical protein